VTHYTIKRCGYRAVVCGYCAGLLYNIFVRISYTKMYSTFYKFSVKNLRGINRHPRGTHSALITQSSAVGTAWLPCGLMYGIFVRTLQYFRGFITVYLYVHYVPITQILMNLNFIDPQTRVLNYF